MLTKEKQEADVSRQQVRHVMKQEFGLVYRRAFKVPIQSNSERCLVLRQQYAMVMLDLLLSGKKIINVDQSWVNETNFTNMMWC